MVNNFLSVVLILTILITQCHFLKENSAIFKSLKDFEYKNEVPKALRFLIDWSKIKNLNNIDIVGRYIKQETSEKLFYFLDEFLSKFDSKTVRLDLPTDFYPKMSISEPRYHFIVLMDDYCNFENIVTEATNKNRDYVGKFFVHLFDKKPGSLVLSFLFTDAAKVDVVDIVVLVWNTDAIYVYTYFPFSFLNCGFVIKDETLIGKFQPENSTYISQIENCDLFPNKIFLKYECEIPIAVTHIAPFIIQVTYTYFRSTYSGIEWKILEDINRVLKFKLRITDNTYQGEILFVNNTRIELFVGRLPFALEGNNTSTTTYMTSKLVIVLPKGRQYTSLERLLYPFDLKIWLGIHFYIFSGVIVIVFLLTRSNRHLLKSLILGKRQDHLLNLISVIFSNPVKVPELTFPKFLLMCWILLFLIMRVAYQANLFELLRTNRSKPVPKTLSEVVQEGYALFCTEAIKNMIEKIPELNNTVYTVYLNNISDMIMLEWMSEKKAHDKVGVIVTEESFFYYKLKNSTKAHQMDVVKSRIFSQNIAINLKKNSIYKGSIDRIINGLLASGWVEFYKRNFTWMKELKFSGSNDFEILLTMKQIWVIFVVKAFGSLLSIVIFIIEYFSEYLI